MENTGTIGFLGKGFGFIKIEGRSKDLFFHAKNLVDVSFDSLQVGDPVSYEDIESTSKGDAASGVRLA